MKQSDIRTQFEEAYETFLDPIFLFLASRLGNRERAKELSQETFMRAWKYLADGNTIHEMRPFLYTTAYNLFKNELRRKREIRSLETMYANDGFEPVAPDIGADRKLEQQLLVAEIAALPDAYRDVLTLRYIDGLPVKDIAAMLEESPVTISVRIHRALAKLKHAYVSPHQTKTA
jgi:RNA polymerase sigma-70 factor (ECF subfamily)